MDKVAVDIAPYFPSKEEAKRALAELTKRVLHRKILQGQSKPFDNATIAREAPGGGQKRKSPDEGSQEENGDVGASPPSKRIKIDEPAQDFEFGGYVVPSKVAEAFVSKIDDLMDVDTELAQSIEEMSQKWSRPGCIFPDKAIFDISSDETYALECLVLCAALTEEDSPIPMAVYVLGRTEIPESLWEPEYATKCKFVQCLSLETVMLKCSQVWRSMDWRSLGMETADFHEKCKECSNRARVVYSTNGAPDIEIAFILASVNPTSRSDQDSHAMKFIQSFQSALLPLLTGSTMQSIRLEARLRILAGTQSVKSYLYSYWNSYDVIPIDLYAQKNAKVRFEALMGNARWADRETKMDFLLTPFTFYSAGSSSRLPPGMGRFYANMLKRRPASALVFSFGLRSYNHFDRNSISLTDDGFLDQNIYASPLSESNYVNASILALMAATLAVSTTEDFFESHLYKEAIELAANIEEMRDDATPIRSTRRFFMSDLPTPSYEDIPLFSLINTAPIVKNVNFLDGLAENVETITSYGAGPMFRNRDLLKDLRPMLTNAFRLQSVDYSKLGLPFVAAMQTYHGVLYTVPDDTRIDGDDFFVQFNEIVLKDDALLEMWKQIIDLALHKTPLTVLITRFLEDHPRTRGFALERKNMTIDGTGMVRLGLSHMSVKLDSLEMNGLEGFKASVFCTRVNFETDWVSAVRTALCAIRTMHFLHEYAKGVDKTACVLFDMGYAFQNLKEHRDLFAVETLYLSEVRHWSDRDIYIVLTNSAARHRSELAMTKLLLHARGRLDLSESPLHSALFDVDYILTIGKTSRQSTVKIDVTTVPVVALQKAEEMTSELLEKFLQATFGDIKVLPFPTADVKDDYIAYARFQAYDATFRVFFKEGGNLFVRMTSLGPGTVSQIDNILKNAEALNYKSRSEKLCFRVVSGAFQKQSRKNKEALINSLLDNWFIPADENPVGNIARSSGVAKNYVYSSSEPTYKDLFPRGLQNRSDVIDYLCEAVEQGPVTFVSMVHAKPEYGFQQVHNLPDFRWLMASGNIPHFPSFRHKTDMSYLIPNMDRISPDMLQRSKDGTTHVEFGARVELLPVVRYANRSGQTAYFKNADVDGSVTCGTFYYLEPTSVVYLNTQMANVPKFISKFDLAMKIKNGDLDMSGLMNARKSKKDDWIDELDKIIKRFIKLEAPEEGNPFGEEFTSAWASLLTGGAYEADASKLPLVRNKTFLEVGRYTKTAQPDKIMLTIQDMSQTPEYFVKSRTGLVRLLGELDYWFCIILPAIGVNAVVFLYEPVYQGFNTEVMDVRSRIASYDSLVTVGY